MKKMLSALLLGGAMMGCYPDAESLEDLANYAVETGNSWSLASREKELEALLLPELKAKLERKWISSSTQIQAVNSVDVTLNLAPGFEVSGGPDTDWAPAFSRFDWSMTPSRSLRDVVKVEVRYTYFANNRSFNYTRTVELSRLQVSANGTVDFVFEPSVQMFENTENVTVSATRGGTGSLSTSLWESLEAAVGAGYVKLMLDGIEDYYGLR